MKKLILAVVLYATAVGLASAATESSPLDNSYRGAFSAFPDTIFVRGLNGDWGTTNPMAFDSNTGTYTATLSLTPEVEDTFKIASDDWTTVDLSNVAFDLTGINSQTLPMSDVGGGDSLLTIDTAGLYLFTLDISSWDGSYPEPAGPFDLTISRVVPVPAAGLLLLSALGGLGFLRRK